LGASPVRRMLVWYGFRKEENSMTTRQIALAGTLLALVFIAHWSGRLFTIGPAQLAPSIAIYVFMALLLAADLGWGALAGIGLACGILTMIATGSPFPPANIPAHGLGFLSAAALTKGVARNGRELGIIPIIGIIAVTLVVSWTLFAVVTWFGLTFSWFGMANENFLGQTFRRSELIFGQGIFAWWLSGFIGVAIPTFVIAVILTPILYRSVRPVLIRQGMLEGSMAADAR
jgi:hypothetical protein